MRGWLCQQSRERLISFPTLVRLLPKACRRVPAQVSRRQYLSRMDRCQHGRSGANFRTMGSLDQSKIVGFTRVLSADLPVVADSKQGVTKCCTKPGKLRIFRNDRQIS